MTPEPGCDQKKFISEYLIRSRKNFQMLLCCEENNPPSVTENLFSLHHTLPVLVEKYWKAQVDISHDLWIRWNNFSPLSYQDGFDLKKCWEILQEQLFIGIHVFGILRSDFFVNFLETLHWFL